MTGGGTGGAMMGGGTGGAMTGGEDWRGDDRRGIGRTTGRRGVTARRGGGMTERV